MVVKTVLWKTTVFTIVAVQASAHAAEIPTEFGESAFQHLAQLVSFGVRSAGSENERRAIDYVKTELEQTGLQVTVEPFEFSGFEWREVDFQLGGKRYVPEVIGFNPYGGELSYRGRALILDPGLSEEQLKGLDLEGAVAVTLKTDSPGDYFRLLPKKPKLIIQLREQDFLDLPDPKPSDSSLVVSGSIKNYRSANVIGALSVPPGSRSEEIIISAHLDSYKNSPGADDNGSGVGVLIELARHFATIRDGLTTSLKFVAFGAEEVGALGARTYLTRHKTELENCTLLFNIDRVGGPGPSYIETLGGVKGIPSEKGESQIPKSIADKAWEGLESNWRINAPNVLPVSSLMRASNRPDWLVNAIKDSVDESGLTVSHTTSLGGDSFVFSQAGYVASGIATVGNIIHSPEDVASQIQVESLQKCGVLVSQIVLRVMAK